MDSSAVSARLIGAIFVEKGLITEDQLEVALDQQRETGERLGEILVEQFGVERLDLASALAEQWAEYERQGLEEERLAQTSEVAAAAEKPRPALEPLPASIKRPLGEIFVERGLVTDDQLEEALEQQRKEGGRLGEILVASGRLSRLELASALADQWASFQKLRPPSQEAEPAAPAAPDRDVLPTPEAVEVATPALAAEAAGRLDALAARVDQLAADRTDWKPQLEKVAELLRSRIEHLEETVARGHEHAPEGAASGAAGEELREQLAALAARIDALPQPSDEWRTELAQVAENLRTRIERVEAASADDPLPELRGALEALGARIDALPAPSEEWRDAVAGLAARIDALPAPSEEWRDAVGELEAKVAALPAPSEDWRDAVAELEGKIAGLPAPSEEWRDVVSEVAAKVDALPAPSEDWRDAVADLAARVDALPAPSEDWRDAIAGLAARIDSLPAPSEDWRGAVAELAARVDALPAPSEEWRDAVAGLTARVDALPAPSEDWRDAVSALEGRIADAAGRDTVDDVRRELAALAARVDALPAPDGEWRAELAALADRVDELAAAQGGWEAPLAEAHSRLESLAAAATRSDLAEVADNLRTRIERVEQRGAAPEEAVAELRDELARLSQRLDAAAEGWRAPLAEVVARIEALPAPSEEWRDAVASLAARVDDALRRTEDGETVAAIDALGRRVEQVEAGIASSEERADAVAGLIEQVAGLAGRVDGLAAVDERVRDLAARIESAPADEGWREAAAELSARIDALPAPSDEWREHLGALAGRVDALRGELAAAATSQADQIREDLAALAARVDALPVLDGLRGELAAAAAGLLGRLEGVEQRLGETVGDLSARIDATDAGVAGAGARLDDALREIAALTGLSQQVAELGERLGEQSAVAAGLEPRVAELFRGAERMRGRADELSGRIDELAARRDASEVERELSGRLDASDGAMAALSERVDELPRSLDERVAVAERAEAADGRIDGVAAALEAGLSSIRASLPDPSALDGLRSDLERQGARLEGLDDSVGALGRHVNEKTASRTAELSALRARLESVEGALSEARSWPEAVGAAYERIEKVELELIEASASEAVARSDEIASVRAELAGRVEAIEHAQASATEVRELGEALRQVERRVDERLAQSEAATGAVESAVREGILSLGERLAASGEAYLETGRELGRSLAGLGLAVAAADAHGDEPRATDRPETAAAFLAFAPTAEGYRLVECAGAPPVVGDTIEVDGCEGTLVVTRAGASPLPFDARACVYLDRA